MQLANTAVILNIVLRAAKTIIEGVNEKEL